MPPQDQRIPGDQQQLTPDSGLPHDPGFVSEVTCTADPDVINAPMVADIGTDWIPGEHVQVGFGFNRQHGNIVTELWLRAAQDPTAQVQVLKNHFAPAVSWQSSILLEGGVPNRMTVYNQGSGCCGLGMWGQSAAALKYDNNLSLISTSWYPLYSDHYHPNFQGWGHIEGLTSVFTSPCITDPSSEHYPAYEADEKSHVFTKLVGTGGAGKAVQLTYRASYRWRHTKTWKSYAGELALYLGGTAAQAGSLQLYLVGSNGALVDGPIPLHQAGALTASGQCYSTQHYTTTFFDNDDSTCLTHITGSLDYAVFVWTIGGRDMAVAVQAAGHGATLNYARMGDPSLHPNAQEPNFNYHTWFDRKSPASLQAGAVDTYEIVHTIGTLRQLNALGFKVDVPTPCSLCLGSYPDCDAACKAFNKSGGTCGYPDSILFGQCCTCW